MKIFLFFTLIFVLFTPETNFASAETQKNYYAKITSKGCFFYDQPNENSLLFEIPETYFVLLTENANEEFYCAKYGNCIGYVRKNDVVPMKDVPTNPYATDFTFRVTSMSGLSLMNEATFESDELISLNFLEEDINFYGNLQGQEFFPNSTDIWYYCSYTKNNRTYYGYLFSYYCDFQQSIPKNNEYFEEITSSLVFKEIPAISSNSDTITAIIILAVIISILLCCYFFITPKKKPRIKTARRKKDYYELTENDLN